MLNGAPIGWSDAMQWYDEFGFRLIFEFLNVFRLEIANKYTRIISTIIR